MARTVFFGPFIGEFGWELSFWHGWVRKVCRAEFRSYRKIACSFPGREPFYPDVDEFWPLPEPFLRLKTSANGYYTDGWRGGYPGILYPKYTLRGVLGALRRFEWPRKNPVGGERPLKDADIESKAEALLAELRRGLPEDTIFFVPWKRNRYEPDGLEFGVILPEGELPTSGRFDRTKAISFDKQLFEYLEPTPAGEQGFAERCTESRPLISIFPRSRAIRRADKNWPRDSYEELIRQLQARYPERLIAVLGEPGGAFFAGGVPAGCLDLINVDPAHRMDIQIAALKRSILALGGMSGAVFVALAAGCPSLFWGFASSQLRYHRENFMGTPFIYHADPMPSVGTVVEMIPYLERMSRVAGKATLVSDRI